MHSKSHFGGFERVLQKQFYFIDINANYCLMSPLRLCANSGCLSVISCSVDGRSAELLLLLLKVMMGGVECD